VAYLSHQLRPGVLRRLRKERGLSQVHLARKAGLSEATIIRAEKNSRVGPTTLTSLSQALGVTTKALKAAA
jgi:transcriptional regulator with XRE-family HTH domain